MNQYPPQIFKHKAWTPRELERLSNLSPVAIRDLRRRGLAPESEGGKLNLEAVAQILLLSELSAHGFGPKRITGIAKSYADVVRQYALSQRSSWVDETSHEAWSKSPLSKHSSPRYLLISASNGDAIALNDLSEVPINAEAIVSLVNLELLGKRMGEHLADRPSSLAEAGGKIS
ncbi:hypothetical protein [Allopontixanthobacter sp.]|uniref:hypothetical protein n=1 Tax=Allopontixanthobacter sp. TaxID=2906452 RepID=UPI002AB8A9CA|nr:hypothetical protein [Allopontixanthobacter sp.]MDZ4308638.1 hypothetical protein [Allopontixanthobacter sp.]